MRRPAILCLLLLGAACSGGSSSADAGPAADADPFAPDADPFAPDANPLAPDAGDEPPAIAACYLTCASPADCAQPGPLFGADNYTCDEGVCQWTGCNTTAECTETYQNAGYVCAMPGDTTIPSCYRTCATAGDCDLGTPLMSADNHTCEGGACVWTGCNTTAECTETYQSPDYICAVRGAWTTPACYPTCATATDCDLGTPLHGPDNYTCETGACVWTGCNTTTECTATLMNPDYVCR